jgi:putative lipoic acid-binding regulatory protein
MGTRINNDAPFDGTPLQFPVQFELKLFMRGKIAEADAIAAITALCKTLAVPVGPAGSRPSQGGNYYCLTVPVTVDSKDTFDRLFAAARDLPGVKMVL